MKGEKIYKTVILDKVSDWSAEETSEVSGPSDESGDFCSFLEISHHFRIEMTLLFRIIVTASTSLLDLFQMGCRLETLLVHTWKNELEPYWTILAVTGRLM